jgi:AraC-like DNA-binding protein/ligand-binding sensor protein
VDDRRLLEALLRSEVYREFRRAFAEATGLPIALRPADLRAPPLARRKPESPFCALVANREDGCSHCRQASARLARAAARQTATLDCAFGLSETAVPIRLGERVIGYLQVGQVFRTRPTSARFDRVVRHLAEPALNGATRHFRTAYFRTPVVSQRKYRSIVKMLDIYARHLAGLANQIATGRTRSELPMISRAREFIQRNHGEKLSLAAVARAVGASSFHFCKTFKKVTGLNFTAHLARVRVESAKSLLLDPHLRVSEIAFRAGFQSLAHFNRVFRRLVGESPTGYRARLPARGAA